MPVIQKIEHSGGQRSAVWEVKEDEFALLEMASLNQSDADAYALITNPGRRLEWLAVRVLLKAFYHSPPTIIYKENGKPMLDNCSDKVSISHSGTMVALALHPTQTPGIDIERLHPRIIKIAHRFLGEAEKRQLGDNPSIEQLTIIWGAKEVLFKVYGDGGISFINDFKITLAAGNKLEGLILKGGKELKIPMEYRLLQDYILVKTDYTQSAFEKNI